MIIRARLRLRLDRRNDYGELESLSPLSVRRRIVLGRPGDLRSLRVGLDDEFFRRIILPSNSLPQTSYD